MTNTKLYLGAFGIMYVFFAYSAAQAQYVPPQAGMLGVGAVTETSIEWTFSAGGGLITEVQLFVGDETAPRMTAEVSQANPITITEKNLLPGKRYDERRVRMVYYGTSGPLSAAFPAVRTLPPMPAPAISPVVPSSANLMFDAGESFGLPDGVEWQVWNDSDKTLHDWVKTRWLQLGPFEGGKTYVFKFRSRDAEGRVTAWSGNISYVMPASPLMPQPPTPPTTQVRAGVSGLRVRILPSLAGKILTVIRPGTSYPVLEMRDGWHKLQITPTLSGWSFAKYLTDK